MAVIRAVEKGTSCQKSKSENLMGIWRIHEEMKEDEDSTLHDSAVYWPVPGPVDGRISWSVAIRSRHQITHWSLQY